MTSILSQKWYILGPPWAYCDYAGTMILAGSDDPNVATSVCDTMDMTGQARGYDDEVARAVAQHIVDLHNASIAG